MTQRGRTLKKNAVRRLSVTPASPLVCIGRVLFMKEQEQQNHSSRGRFVGASDCVSDCVDWWGVFITTGGLDTSLPCYIPVKLLSMNLVEKK